LVARHAGELNIPKDVVAAIGERNSVIETERGNDEMWAVAAAVTLLFTQHCKEVCAREGIDTASVFACS
jgi:hypothetical protein